MLVGKVKWFNAIKGYGFLTSQGLTEDVFVHHTAIAMAGYRTLEENAMVEFELANNGERLMAVMVNLIEASSSDADFDALGRRFEA